MSPTTRKIVLAEDNANDAELTLAALREQGVGTGVIVIRDGEEALDYLYRRDRFAERQDGLPLLLVLDLKMPKVDGIEVLRQVKADAALRRMPIVVLTSSREEQDVARSYEFGANAYVVKPVDFDEFVKTVKGLGGFWTEINEPPPRH